MTSRKAARFDRAPDDARRNLLARIHVLKKELALSDESYRDVLERLHGKRTASVLELPQLQAVVAEFERLGAGRRSANRPLADSPMAWRCRALWRSLYQLDEIDTDSEQALAAFVWRQTGRDDMRWCTAPQLSTVIEALKDWAARAGVDLAQDADPLVPKRALARAQWARLHACGWAQVEGDWGLRGFAHRTWCTPNARSVDQLEAEHLDKLSAKLGRIVREQRCGRRRREEEL
jgi:phage gp16-like protein